MNQNLYKISFCLLVSLLLITNAFELIAQPGQGRGGPRGGGGMPEMEIIGTVIDNLSNAPLEFATISLFSKADSSLVTGGITDVEGKFSIKRSPKPGQRPSPMYAVIEFIGYEKTVIDPVAIDREQLKQGNFTTDLGEIRISPGGVDLSEVEVRAERSETQFSLDKRVFNVGKDLANKGGTAADILDNVPSVTVDTEGEVSLRGSTGVRILVDGKPSSLAVDGNALRQIPSSMIESVEVVTNPSARYEAEGMAGIINIVLKKEKRSGFNGSFEATVGVPAVYGVGANVNYRKGKINWFLGYGLNYRIGPGGGKTFQWVEKDDGSTIFTNQTRDMERGGLTNSIRGGLDFYFSDKEVLTGALLYKVADEQNYTEIKYSDYVDNLDNLVSNTLRIDDEFEDESSLEYSLNYKKEFSSRKHTLSALVSYEDRLETEGSDLDQVVEFVDGRPKSNLLQRSNNDEGTKTWLFQVDYEQPLKGKDHKYELGLRTSLRDIGNDYLVEEEENENWKTLSNFSNEFRYDEDIYAAYGQYGNRFGAFSFLAGLRGEYSVVKTELRQGDIPANERDYFNLFPSLFLNYELSEGNSLQVSYSRRVQRPRFWNLNPFFTYSDPRNFYSGNPNLNPEFTDSYEFNYLRIWDKMTISSGLFYRHTEGVIQRVQSVNVDTFITSNQLDTSFITTSTTRPENLDTRDDMGVELTFSYSGIKWLRVDGSVNAYRSIVDGTNLNDAFQADAYTMDGRLGLRFSFWDSDLQLRGNFRAPRTTTQGRMKAMAMMDFGWSRDFGKAKNWTANISIKDVFNSRRRRYENFGENDGNRFYSEGNFQWRARAAVLTVSYRVNQKKSRGRRGGNGNYGGGGGF